MSDQTLTELRSAPSTRALQQALPGKSDPALAADLLFLERWERAPSPAAADMLRIAQLRRANPELAAAIRAEVAAESRR